MVGDKAVNELRSALDSVTAAIAFSPGRYHGRLMRIVGLLKRLLESMGD